MRDNNSDKTIERNYISKWRFLIKEWELVKAKRHPHFRFLEAFYRHHNVSRQTFSKYHNKFLEEKDERSLLPEKRGPKYKTGKPTVFIENKVIQIREETGANKFEICELLKEKLKQFTPSPSGVYNILKRHNLNKKTQKMQEKKRAIIKQRAGELGHIDCHYLSRDLIVNDNKRYFLVGVIDSLTRILWVEVVKDMKSLTVMFSVMRIFSMLSNRYGIRFEEVLTDNGAEFGSGKNKKNKETNPFERMLSEIGIKHRYTRPYRPQTNGKIERFWRTIESELIEDAVYEDIEKFKDELLHYLVYYNEHRPHQALGGKTPQALRERLLKEETEKPKTSKL